MTRGVAFDASATRSGARRYNQLSPLRLYLPIHWFGRDYFTRNIEKMEDDYYSVESILAENQKIQCTFKVDIPDMGHLDGGNERDVRRNDF